VDVDTILTTTHQFSLANGDNGFSAQSIPIVVGLLNKIVVCYIIVNNNAYKVPSVLQTINLTFNICYCLDCKYPPNAYSLWMLLQKAFYGIHIYDDKVSIMLNSIIGKILKDSR